MARSLSFDLKRLSRSRIEPNDSASLQGYYISYQLDDRKEEDIHRCFSVRKAVRLSSRSSSIALSLIRLFSRQPRDQMPTM